MGSQLLCQLVGHRPGEGRAGLAQVPEKIGETVLMVQVGDEGDGFFGEGLAGQFVPIQAQVEGQGLQVGQVEVAGDLLAELL